MSAKLDDELRIIGQCLRLLEPLAPMQRASIVLYLQQRVTMQAQYGLNSTWGAPIKPPDVLDGRSFHPAND